MSPETLPTILDVRKAAVRGADVYGTLRPSDLSRFRPLVGESECLIQVAMHFSQDEERRYLLHLEVEADIVVPCQRCLDPMPMHLASDSTLAIVWNDVEAAHLPRHLDALVVAHSTCNLWEVVEDELILGLPPYNFHPPDDCNLKCAEYSGALVQETDVEMKPNPFNVLEHFKPGK